MIGFEVVTVGVAASAAVITIGAYLRGPSPLDGLGRHWRSWFDQPEDIPLESRPFEDERDAPIPKRRLRGRPD
jgi:hypothetical protein